MSPVKWKDKDRGWKKLQKEIEKAKNKPHVAVGIFGALASADHGGIPNVEVASAHEFGMEIDHPGGTAYIPGGGWVSNEAAQGKNYPRTKPHKIQVPERSFIRGSIDEKQTAIQGMVRKIGDMVLAGKTTTKQGLETLGAYVKGQIQERMSKGIPPPLKAATVARKGSSVPLIDTGQLRASIAYETKNT